MKLPGVTLVCFNGLNKSKEHFDCLYAINESIKEIEFDRILFLTAYKTLNEAFVIGNKKIEIVEVKPHSKREYNFFMINKLSDWIKTPYVLTIQSDGFILNPSRWDKRFYDYDYIGAPWPNIYKGVRVGNGGFSWRSKKLLDDCRNIKHNNVANEDGVICINNRKMLMDHGNKFAPLEIAILFSTELPIPEFNPQDYTKTFGFHNSSSDQKYMINMH